MSLLIGVTLGLAGAQAPPRAPTATPDPWAPIRVMEGAWEGESEGEPGKGTVKRAYEIVSPDEFVETFEIASTGAYEIYSRSRFKRRRVH